jgi:hypothetical protein
VRKKPFAEAAKEAAANAASKGGGTGVGSALTTWMNQPSTSLEHLLAGATVAAGVAVVASIVGDAIKWVTDPPPGGVTVGRDYSGYSDESASVVKSAVLFSLFFTLLFSAVFGFLATASIKGAYNGDPWNHALIAVAFLSSFLSSLLAGVLNNWRAGWPR